jgi:hypothetical protein
LSFWVTIQSGARRMERRAGKRLSDQDTWVIVIGNFF